MSDSEDEFVSASEGEDSPYDNSFNECFLSTNITAKSEKHDTTKMIPIKVETSSSVNVKCIEKDMDSENEKKSIPECTSKTTSKESLVNEGQLEKPVTIKPKEEELKKTDGSRKKSDFDNDWDCDWDNILQKSSSFKRIEKIYTNCDLPKEDASDELESLNDEKNIESDTQEIVAKIQEAAEETVVEPVIETCPQVDEKIVEEDEEVKKGNVSETSSDNIVSTTDNEPKVEEVSKIEEIPEVLPKEVVHEKVKPRIKVIKPTKKIGKKEAPPSKTPDIEVAVPKKHCVSRINSSQSSSNSTDVSSYEKIDSPVIVEENDWFDEVTKEIITKNETKRRKEVKSSSLFDWNAINAVVSSVGDSISNAVESSLGIPSAEEMARVVTKQQKASCKGEQDKEINPLDKLCHDTPNQQNIPSIGGIFSGLVNTSLDALETLGKKTFETLTVTEKDGDRERRKFLFEPEKPGNLSDILKELRNKEKSDNDNMQNMRSIGFGSTSHKNLSTSFVQLFEKHGGLFNLEGLEMLTQRIRYSTSPTTTSFDEHVDELSVNDLPPVSMDKFEKELKKLVKQVKVPFNPNHILGASKNQEEIYLESTLLDNSSIETIFQNSIDALALLTAESVQVLHKLGQLFSIAPQIPEDVIVLEMTKLFCRRITYFSEEYANLFNSLTSDSKIDEMVTNIFYESTNATLYIKKAVALLKPFYS